MNIREATRCFKVLGEETRLRILWILKKAERELCVCEIMKVLKKSQPHISRHLRELKICGLVKERKEGRWVFYSLNPKVNQFYHSLLETISFLGRRNFLPEEKRLKKILSLREKDAARKKR
ncbi:MAG: metalloregulator ArsR/SmtB family transcription factor [candidate division WOR-3 bacterium]